MTDLEKANDLLRRFVDWETSNTSNLINILVDAKAYLATRPEPVDPDLIAAGKIAETVGWGHTDPQDPMWEGSATKLCLMAIKRGRELERSK